MQELIETATSNNTRAVMKKVEIKGIEKILENPILIEPLVDVEGEKVKAGEKVLKERSKIPAIIRAVKHLP